MGYGGYGKGRNGYRHNEYSNDYRHNEYSNDYRHKEYSNDYQEQSYKEKAKSSHESRKGSKGKGLSRTSRPDVRGESKGNRKGKPDRSKRDSAILLSGFQLADEDLSKELSRFRHVEKFTTLDLSHNYLTSQSFAEIISFVDKSSNLRKLILHHNHFGGGSPRHWDQLEFCPGVDEIHISHNKLTMEDAIRIASAVSRHDRAMCKWIRIEQNAFEMETLFAEFRKRKIPVCHFEKDRCKPMWCARGKKVHIKTATSDQSRVLLLPATLVRDSPAGLTDLQRTDLQDGPCVEPRRRNGNWEPSPSIPRPGRSVRIPRARPQRKADVRASNEYGHTPQNCPTSSTQHQPRSVRGSSPQSLLENGYSSEDSYTSSTLSSSWSSSYSSLSPQRVIEPVVGGSGPEDWVVKVPVQPSASRESMNREEVSSVDPQETDILEDYQVSCSRSSSPESHESYESLVVHQVVSSTSNKNLPHKSDRNKRKESAREGKDVSKKNLLSSTVGGGLAWACDGILSPGALRGRKRNLQHNREPSRSKVSRTVFLLQDQDVAKSTKSDPIHSQRDVLDTSDPNGSCKDGTMTSFGSSNGKSKELSKSKWDAKSAKDIGGPRESDQQNGELLKSKGYKHLDKSPQSRPRGNCDPIKNTKGSVNRENKKNESIVSNSNPASNKAKGVTRREISNLTTDKPHLRRSISRESSIESSCSEQPSLVGSDGELCARHDSPEQHPFDPTERSVERFSDGSEDEFTPESCVQHQGSEELRHRSCSPPLSNCGSRVSYYSSLQSDFQARGRSRSDEKFHHEPRDRSGSVEDVRSESRYSPVSKQGSRNGSMYRSPEPEPSSPHIPDLRADCKLDVRSDARCVARYESKSDALDHEPYEESIGHTRDKSEDPPCDPNQDSPRDDSPVRFHLESNVQAFDESLHRNRKATSEIHKQIPTGDVDHEDTHMSPSYSEHRSDGEFSDRSDDDPVDQSREASPDRPMKQDTCDFVDQESEKKKILNPSEYGTYSQKSCTESNIQDICNELTDGEGPDFENPRDQESSVKSHKSTGKRRKGISDKHQQSKVDLSRTKLSVDRPSDDLKDHSLKKSSSSFEDISAHPHREETVVRCRIESANRLRNMTSDRSCKQSSDRPLPKITDRSSKTKYRSQKEDAVLDSIAPSRQPSHVQEANIESEVSDEPDASSDVFEPSVPGPERGGQTRHRDCDNKQSSRHERESASSSPDILPGVKSRSVRGGRGHTNLTKECSSSLRPQAKEHVKPEEAVIQHSKVRKISKGVPGPSNGQVQRKSSREVQSNRNRLSKDAVVNDRSKVREKNKHSCEYMESKTSGERLCPMNDGASWEKSSGHESRNRTTKLNNLEEYRAGPGSSSKGQIPSDKRTGKSSSTSIAKVPSHEQIKAPTNAKSQRSLNVFPEKSEDTKKMTHESPIQPRPKTKLDQPRTGDQSSRPVSPKRRRPKSLNGTPKRDNVPSKRTCIPQEATPRSWRRRSETGESEANLEEEVDYGYDDVVAASAHTSPRKRRPQNSKKATTKRPAPTSRDARKIQTASPSPSKICEGSTSIPEFPLANGRRRTPRISDMNRIRQAERCLSPDSEVCLQPKVERRKLRTSPRSDRIRKKPALDRRAASPPRSKASISKPGDIDYLTPNVNDQRHHRSRRDLPAHCNQSLQRHSSEIPASSQFVDSESPNPRGRKDEKMRRGGQKSNN